MASLASQQQAAAIYYSVLGRTPSLTEINTYGQQLEGGTQTAAQLAQFFISSSGGNALYSGKTDSEILQIIYTREYGSAATSQQLTDFLNGNTLSSAVSNVVSGLLNYSGSDATILAQQTAFQNTVNTLLYPSTASAALGQGASDIQAILHVIGSTVTADAVNYFGAKINAGMTITQAAAANIAGRSYLTSLSDDAFIARLFQFGYERAPSSAESASFLSLLQGARLEPIWWLILSRHCVAPSRPAI